jgi:hypothetical protein
MEARRLGCKLVQLGGSPPLVSERARTSSESRREFGAGADERVSSGAGVCGCVGTRSHSRAERKCRCVEAMVERERSQASRSLVKGDMLGVGGAAALSPLSQGAECAGEEEERVCAGRSAR